jgi:hypothetical protein
VHKQNLAAILREAERSFAQARQSTAHRFLFFSGHQKEQESAAN